MQQTESSLNGTNHILVYADDVNMLDENTETLLEDRRELVWGRDREK
jgi:hypothetical protein